MAIVTIKIRNGSKKSFDADQVSVNLTYGSSGKQAEDVIGPDVDRFEGTIAQGRSQSAEYGFALPESGMKDILVEITPGFGYTPALFSGHVS